MTDTTTRRGRHVADLGTCCIHWLDDQDTTVAATQTQATSIFKGRRSPAPELCDDHAQHLRNADRFRPTSPRHRADEPLDRLVSLLTSPAAFDRHMATLHSLDQAGHFSEFGEEG